MCAWACEVFLACLGHPMGLKYNRKWYINMLRFAVGLLISEAV